MRQACATRFRIGVMLALAATAALILSGCATQPSPVTDDPAPTAYRVPPLDAAVADRILALDPQHITELDVRETLALGPVPHVILLHGGLYPVHLMMASFGQFLVGMGYPEDHIRNPVTKDWSISPYRDSAHVAGMVAWHYERDGMRPLIVGHSQGGMQAIKVLHELNGEFQPAIAVWNPVTGSPENRTTLVDPLNGKVRPVVGLSVSYVSAVAAGGAAFILPNQWSMIGRLRTIPDSVDDFTGFFIEGDKIAWTFNKPDTDDEYRRSGSAAVRNVLLPAEYSHISLPDVQALALDPSVRAWVNGYAPDRLMDTAALPEEARNHILWAADVWFSVKRAWSLEAQHYVRTRRM